MKRRGGGGTRGKAHIFLSSPARTIIDLEPSFTTSTVAAAPTVSTLEVESAPIRDRIPDADVDPQPHPHLQSDAITGMSVLDPVREGEGGEAQKMCEEVTTLRTTVVECRKAIEQLCAFAKEAIAPPSNPENGDTPPKAATAAAKSHETQLIIDSIQNLRRILERVEQRTLEFEFGLGKTIKSLVSTITTKDAKLARLVDKVESLEYAVLDHLRDSRKSEKIKTPHLTNSDVQEIASATAKKVSTLMDKSNRSLEHRIEAVAQFIEDITATKLGSDRMSTLKR